MTPCNCCQAARLYQAHNQFNPACLYCGARIIQHLGTMQIQKSDCTRRRRDALATWVAHGHNEAQIRALASGPLALTPLPDTTQPDSKPPKPRR
jgi:hypothetical protein